MLCFEIFALGNDTVRCSGPTEWFDDSFRMPTITTHVIAEPKTKQ